MDHRTFPALGGYGANRNLSMGYIGKNSGIQLSRADGVHFMLKELVEGNYIRQMPVVSY